MKLLSVELINLIRDFLNCVIKIENVVIIYEDSTNTFYNH